MDVDRAPGFALKARRACDACSPRSLDNFFFNQMPELQAGLLSLWFLFRDAAKGIPVGLCLLAMWASCVKREQLKQHSSLKAYPAVAVPQ
jgi:hypothetical protein